MLSCQQTQELMTRLEYETPSLRQRLAIKLHLLMCRLCRRHKRQVSTLRRLAQRLFASHPQWRLSRASRQRIQQLLSEQTRD